MPAHAIALIILAAIVAVVYILASIFTSRIKADARKAEQNDKMDGFML